MVDSLIRQKNHPEVLPKMAVLKRKEKSPNFRKKEQSPSKTFLENLVLFK